MMNWNRTLNMARTLTYFGALTVCALALACGVAKAQQPSVSGITIDGLDTTSFRVVYTVGGVAGSWAEVYYGTQSGVYPYNTKSINCFGRADACQQTGAAALTITGLKPGTTYYVRATARPHANDDINVCNADACGSVEQVVTTLTGPQPGVPVSPAGWVPVAPDTSGYAVIPLEVGPSGECRAAAAVSKDSWTVTAGTNLGQALQQVSYGTVFELPQGIACKVPEGGGKGYSLPGKPLDTACGGACTMEDPRHRWIVFRTKEVTPADFPPYGSRISPEHAPLLGKFYSSQPNASAQLFDAENGTSSVHHFWFQNVEFEDDPAYSNPRDQVDPDAFTFFARFGSSYQLQNNQFIVLDRVYAHGPGAPIRHYNAFEIGGNHMAMVGTYTSQIETWRPTEWPSKEGTIDNTGATITIPKNNYRLNRSSPLLGMSGNATALLGGPVLNSGEVVGNLYKDHLELQYTAGAGVFTCTGCTAVATSSPATPRTAFRLFRAVIGADGKISNISWNVQEWMTSKYLMAFGVTNSDLQAPGGPYYLDNNYIDGIGMGFYLDPHYSAFSSDDWLYLRNHHIWPKNAFANDPANQWRYEVRQHWEAKRLHRAVVKGNVFSYSWSFQNQGSSIFLSSRSPYIVQAGNDGISDVTVKSNIISHGRSGVECMGGNPMDNGGAGPEPRATRRIQIVNNLMFDLGRWKYCDPYGCPGLGAHYFALRPACQDVVIENNTAGITYGEIPSLLQLGGGQLLGNYLSFRKNILYLSRGASGLGGGSAGDWPANNVQNHDVKPFATYDNTGESPNFKANLDSSFVNIAGSVTPSYSWGQNVMIGGWRDTNGTLAGAVDMSNAEVQDYARRMPAGDIYPSGNSIAARERQLKLASPATFDLRLTGASAAVPGGIGIDYEILYQDQGRVIQIERPRRSATSAEFTYMAPDNRACVVDVGRAGAWTRTSDGGGARKRKLTVSGLQPTTEYQYRIVCYYRQVNDGVLYTDYAPDQITDGVFSTVGTETTLGLVPFTLADVPRSTKVRVTFTPVTGTSTTVVCTASPCEAELDAGSYQVKIEHLDNNNKVLAKGTGERIFLN